MEGIHGLPAVSATTFFPKSSKKRILVGDESTKITEHKNPQEKGDTKNTAYMWDSMDEEDRADTIDILKQSDEWVIWKSKDKWSTSLTSAGFHQLLYIKKDIQEKCWG